MSFFSFLSFFFSYRYIEALTLSGPSKDKQLAASLSGIVSDLVKIAAKAWPEMVACDLPDLQQGHGFFLQQVLRIAEADYITMPSLFEGEPSFCKTTNFCTQLIFVNFVRLGELMKISLYYIFFHTYFDPLE